MSEKKKDIELSEVRSGVEVASEASKSAVEVKNDAKIVGRGQISLDALVQALTENGLSEIEYEENGCRIHLSRQVSQIPASVPPVATPVVPPSSEVQVTPLPSAPIPESINAKTHPGTVRSPMVGVVYVAPEPGAEPFVRVGDNVNPGQTLLIIEAMKVLNPIKATRAGKVVEIMVHNQKPVEYDEPLLIISD